MQTSSCGNCKNYIPKKKKCEVGHSEFYKYGAHFLCDDFSLLGSSKSTMNGAFDSFMGKDSTILRRCKEVKSASSHVDTYQLSHMVDLHEPFSVSINNRVLTNKEFSIYNPQPTGYVKIMVPLSDREMLTIDYVAK